VNPGRTIRRNPTIIELVQEGVEPRIALVWAY